MDGSRSRCQGALLPCSAWYGESKNKCMLFSLSPLLSSVASTKSWSTRLYSTINECVSHRLFPSSNQQAYQGRRSLAYSSRKRRVSVERDCH